ncbi:MAG: sensor histidine kinase [Streptosporangiaceae bacterium]|nr:sensor histidine kinase [Streptosporangiaceae bacterium]MBV9856685.1 sensor histidine kinase [Streptosporangiaceae bacterium]
MDDAWTWWHRWRQSPAGDAVFALAMTALLVYGSYGEAHPNRPQSYFVNGHHVPYTPAAAYLLVVAACLALAWRRRWPAAVLVVSATAVAIYSLLGYVNGAALLAPVAALYSLATRISVRRAIAWSAGTLIVLMLASLAANPFGGFGGGFDIMPFVAAAACFAGIAVGNRRAYINSLRDSAERDAQRRIDEERLRIARELHDVVAHTMATISVQAAAAAHVLTERPEQAAESLAAIRAASKDGLRELRAILNVLRQAGEAADPTEPAPGLAGLDALAAGVRQAGLPVTVTVTGRPRPLPAITDLAAFRIIQEALTNSIRHAGAAAAEVSLNYGETDLRLEVTDTGRGVAGDWTAPDGSPGSGPGHGLRGMRERAAAAGGTVETGPGPSGGFRVAARLPAGRSPARGEPAPPAISTASGQGARR